MRKLPMISLLVTAALSTAGQSQETTNGVIRLDPALDEIVSPDTKAELVVSGVSSSPWVTSPGRIGNPRHVFHFLRGRYIGTLVQISSERKRG